MRNFVKYLVALLLLYGLFLNKTQSQSYVSEKVNLSGLNIETKRNYVIKSDAELTSFIEEYRLQKEKPGKIDFKNEMLIIVAMGYCGTTGHRVDIKKIIPKKRQLLVEVVYYYPGKNCFVGDAIIYPAMAIRTKKTDLPVHFVELVKEDTCN